MARYSSRVWGLRSAVSVSINIVVSGYRICDWYGVCLPVVLRNGICFLCLRGLSRVVSRVILLINTICEPHFMLTGFCHVWGRCTISKESVSSRMAQHFCRVWGILRKKHWRLGYSFLILCRFNLAWVLKDTFVLCTVIIPLYCCKEAFSVWGLRLELGSLFNDVRENWEEKERSMLLVILAAPQFYKVSLLIL